MMIQILASIGGIFVLLLVSAFFSGSETALTGASKARMHTLEQKGNRAARTVNGLLVQKDRLIGGILIGNNLVNILASALATSLLIALFGDAGVAYATIVMTALVVVFSEVLPKTYAIHHAEQVALLVAPLMRAVVAVLGPITAAVQILVRGSFRLFGLSATPDLGQRAEEELIGAIELHAKALGEVQEERNMLRSILDLADVEVGEIMTHRKNMVAIDADQPVAKIVADVLASPYTRLPLWRDDPDNIIGVLNVKALLRLVNKQQGRLENINIVAAAKTPWYIPDSTDLLTQLQAFRARHEHFALVVDEYGGLLGLVTLEDILEEIVGDILDEHDIPVAGIYPQSDGSYIVDGTVTIRDLNRQYDWNLPDEEASTVAGLVLYEARTIPEVGRSFVFHGFRFEILKRVRNQITSIRITPESAAESDQQG
jgi:Mg2+/Co2+ transporter CorB